MLWPLSQSDDSSIILQDIYQSIGCKLDSEVLKVLTDDIAALRTFYDLIKPAIETGVIYSAANEVRKLAWIIAREAGLSIPDYLSWLRRHHYSREDCRQIRYVVEAFYWYEPIFAVFAALAHKLLCGKSFEIASSRKIISRDTKPVFKREIRIADGFNCFNMFQLPDDLDVHIYHQFYRALSSWPGYLDKVITDQDFYKHQCKMAGGLKEITETITNRLWVDAQTDKVISPKLELIASVEESLDRSLQATIHAVFLRRSFIKEEISWRKKKPCHFL